MSGPAIPPGVNDYLRVAQIRNRVERDGPHRIDAGGNRESDENENQELVRAGELDDAVNHASVLLRLAYPFPALPASVAWSFYQRYPPSHVGAPTYPLPKTSAGFPNRSGNGWR